MMLELTDEEKKNIKSIVNISTLILHDFNKLKELEINGGNKETSDKIISDIYFHLSLERFLYDCFGNELDRIRTVIECFFSDNDGVSLINELQIAKGSNEHNLVKRRIVTKLCQTRRKTIDELYKESKNKSIAESIKILDITNAIGSDLINTIMVILSNYLEDADYDNIKDKLISFKYNMAYIYPDILDSFLNNNFTIDKDLYWGQFIKGKINHISRNELRMYNVFYVNDFNNAFVSNILNYNAHSSSEEYFEAIISQIYIRAALLLLDEKDLISVKNVIEKRITLERELTNNNDIGALLLETYSKYEQDKNLPKIVMMR